MEKASRSPGTFQPIFPELTSEEENAKTLAGKKLLSGEFTIFSKYFHPCVFVLMNWRKMPSLLISAVCLMQNTGNLILS